MSDLVQIELAIKEGPINLSAVAEADEQIEDALSRYAPLPAKMVVGALAFDRIRQNYELKLPEVKRAGLLGVPIQVVAWLPPKQIVLLDAEDHVIKTLECE